ncbi:MAG: porin family protein [Mailhella sp.]|nr:porin family protein [Mailhella sp.]
MNKIFSALVLSAALVLPCLAQAETGFYAAPKFVLNYQHNKSEISAAGYTASDSKSSMRAGAALAAGYDFMPRFSQPFRAEVEYGIYGNNSMTRTYTGLGSVTSKFGVQTLLVNGYWDFARFSSFVPYVGGGLGLALVRDKTYVDINGLKGMNSENDAVFAAQIGFGCSYELSDTVALDFGYRYLMMADTQTSAYGVTMRGKNNHNHQLMLGARLSF